MLTGIWRHWGSICRRYNLHDLISEYQQSQNEAATDGEVEPYAMALAVGFNTTP